MRQTEKRSGRRLKRKVRRAAAWTLLILLGLIPAVVLTVVAAAVVLPAMFRWRGCLEFGGEWFLLGALFCATYTVSHNLLCNQIFEEGKHG